MTLRITDHPILGAPQKGPRAAFTLNGERVWGRAGEPIAAALRALGVTTHRLTHKGGRPRGVFCGIGRCTDCVMEVDGEVNVRTCVTPLKEGMDVRTQLGRGRELSARSEARSAPSEGGLAFGGAAALPAGKPEERREAPNLSERTETAACPELTDFAALSERTDFAAFSELTDFAALSERTETPKCPERTESAGPAALAKSQGAGDCLAGPPSERPSSGPAARTAGPEPAPRVSAPGAPA